MVSSPVPWWPWGLFAALLALEAWLVLANRQVGAARVDGWLFTHRDHLPIPFLLIGLVTRLLTREPAAAWRQPWLQPLGIALIIVGESLRIWSVGIVGASTRSASVHATRLVQDGPYAVIRNPIYAGNFLLCIGLSGLTASWEAAAACAAYFLIVYRRIIRAEERFLRSAFGSVYDTYCRRVPRVIPHRFATWRAEALQAPFSLKELRKEYQTIAGILCAAALVYGAAWFGH